MFSTSDGIVVVVADCGIDGYSLKTGINGVNCLD